MFNFFGFYGVVGSGYGEDYCDYGYVCYYDGDCGFFEKVGDEIVLWFGDEDVVWCCEEDYCGCGFKDYIWFDECICEDVNDWLIEDWCVDVSDVIVSVSQGEVIFNGIVISCQVKCWVEDVVEDVLGVKYVQNNLCVVVIVIGSVFDCNWMQNEILIVEGGMLICIMGEKVQCCVFLFFFLMGEGYEVLFVLVGQVQWDGGEVF